MSEFALLIDFGSTYTKLRAINLDEAKILGSGQGPSTVTSDINIGMEEALYSLKNSLGKLPPFKYRLASSSAAGGLKMVTIGLVKELTVEAAKRAALGAGAKLVGIFANRLNSTDLKQIIDLHPDIILLAGGTDGGDSQVVTHNAKKLGESFLDCPFIYAGNRSAVDEISNAFIHKNLVVTENVMPEFNVLNIEPARAAIRNIFINRIIHAKGIDKAKGQFDHLLMPTPSAVMEGARLIADGYDGIAGLGELLVIDPGGATTDVHSIATGSPSVQGVIQRGLPETRIKRTVEGDLGMRHNAATILETVGVDELVSLSNIHGDKVIEMITYLSCNPDSVPKSPEEIALDNALASTALKIAMKRHCGSVEVVYTATGPVTAQDGKDLTQIKTLIGTGGVIAHSKDPISLLRCTLSSLEEPNSLRPISPQILIDKDYILFASGLLSQVDPKAAFNLAIEHLTNGK